MVLDSIDVAILCGGRGTRLKNVLGDRPKVMAMIGDRPFLDIILDFVLKYHPRKVVLCAGYRADFLEAYYQDRVRAQELIISKEEYPLGTGGALKRAANLLTSDTVLVLNGDSYCNVDLGDFVHFHRKRSAAFSMVLARSEDTCDYGLVKIGEDGVIICFVEKDCGEKKSRLVNAGIYLIERKLLSMVPSSESYSLEYDFFPELIGRSFYGYVSDSEIIDIGTSARLDYAIKVFSRIENH